MRSERGPIQTRNANSPGDALKALLTDSAILVGGCYDCLSAAIAEDAGFPALFVSGAGVAASAIGMPDLGLLSFGELAQVARMIIRRSGVPVIVDADTGFGNELNTIRSIRELGGLGAAAVTIEDQVFPKRCGHLSGKAVVGRDEFISKIKAARYACDESGMLLIARTDALAVHGLDEALRRVDLAASAGADVTFVEAPADLDQLARIGSAETGAWPMHNLATGAGGPEPSLDELAELGFRLVIEPGATIFPAIHEMRKAARAVVKVRGGQPLRKYRMGPRDIFEAVGLAEWLAIESTFSLEPAGGSDLFDEIE